MQDNEAKEEEEVGDVLLPVERTMTEDKAGWGLVPGCRASRGALCPGRSMDEAWNPEGLAQVGQADNSGGIIGRAGLVLPVPLRHKLLSGQACGSWRLAGVTCNYPNGAGGRCSV